MATRNVTTIAELDELVDHIQRGRGSFVGYQQPVAHISVENDLYVAPIGHLIPALMDALGQAAGAPATPNANGQPITVKVERVE